MPPFEFILMIQFIICCCNLGDMIFLNCSWFQEWLLIWFSFGRNTFIASYTSPCPWWQASTLLERLCATSWTGFFRWHPTHLSFSQVWKGKSGHQAAPGGNPSVRKYTHQDNGAKFWGVNWAFWQHFPPHFGPFWPHQRSGQKRFGWIFRVGWFWEVWGVRGGGARE